MSFREAKTEIQGYIVT